MFNKKQQQIIDMLVELKEKDKEIKRLKDIEKKYNNLTDKSNVEIKEDFKQLLIDNPSQALKVLFSDEVDPAYKDKFTKAIISETALKDILNPNPGTASVGFIGTTPNAHAKITERQELEFQKKIWG